MDKEKIKEMKHTFSVMLASTLYMKNLGSFHRTKTEIWGYYKDNKTN